MLLQTITILLDTTFWLTPRYDCYLPMTRKRLLIIPPIMGIPYFLQTHVTPLWTIKKLKSHL